MNKEYYDFCVNEIGLRPLNPEKTSNEKQDIECLLCGSIFGAILKGKVNNYKKHGLQGCKKCTDKAKYAESRKKNFALVSSKFHIIDEISNDECVPKSKKVKVKNKDCGHVFTAQWDNLKNGTSICPVCNKEEKIKRCRENNNKKHLESLVGKSEFQAYKSKVDIFTRKSYKKHKKIINPNNVKRVVAGGVGYHLDHIVSIKNCFLWGVPPEICGDYRNLRMIEWKENLFKKSRSSIVIPQIITPYVGNVNAMFMLEMESILNKFNHKIEKFKKLGNYNINFLIDSKLAIIFLDHKMFSQQALGSTSYLKKFKKYLSDEKIQAWFIFEDEWNYKKDVIINKLNYHFNSIIIKSVYARNCSIKEVKNDVKNKFLNSFHLQGACKSDINLGAFFEGELLAVMTFSRPRKQMGQKNDGKGKYELSRFCVRSNYNIPGIASKLVSFFVKTYSPNYIFSFSDLRWSDGQVYEKMGFGKESIVKPDYKYVIDGKRKHRWGFRKSLIEKRFPEVWEPTKTEYQMMLEAGVDRVWDCGYIKYSKQID